MSVAPVVRIITGGGATDTVATVLSAPLVVEVRDARGQPARDTPVLFRVSRTLNAAGQLAGPEVVRLRSTTASDPGGPQVLVSERTDSTGRAAVRVHFGFLAGTANIVAVADSLSAQDSTTYTVRPGAATRLEVGPADTSLYVARSYRLRARTFDRWNNERQDPVAFRSGDSVVTIGSSAEVMGLRFGRGVIDVSTSGLSARASVSVVPQGVLAFAVDVTGLGAGIGVVNLDGSGARIALKHDDGPATAPHAPRWSPSGTQIVFQAGHYERSRLFTFDLASGVSTRVTSPSWATAVNANVEALPAYSSDGRWYYFEAGPTYYGGLDIWRAPTDGGGLPERLTSRPQVNFHAAPSPDGSRVAYRSHANTRINLLSLADRRETAVPSSDRAILPRFSPSGASLSFVLSASERSYSGERVGVVYVWPVGSPTARIVTPPERWYYGGTNSWSPDGQWLLARSERSLDLIHVESGLVLPLPWSSGYGEADWKP